MDQSNPSLIKLNFFTGAILGIVGLSLSPEIIQETELNFKMDDIAMLILAVVVIWWYKQQASDQKLSLMPIILSVIGLVIKVAAIFMERSDKEDVGDDIAVAIVLVASLGLIIYMYQKAKKHLIA